MRCQKNGFIFGLTILLMLAAISSQAMPEPAYLLQDDFTLSFGEIGNPLAGGSSIDSMGRIVLWNVEKFAGSFVLSTTANAPAVNIGNQWQMNFNQGTFKITSLPYGKGVTLWEGTVDHFLVTGNMDNSKFSAATIDRPAYESEPTEFDQICSARFTRTSGSWADPFIDMQWGGTYNISFDADTVPESSMMIGNLQGKLLAVPEPSGLMLIGSGLAGLVGIVKRRRYS